MTNTIAIEIPIHTYLHRLRALGAWWRLGSSALNPELLVTYVEYVAVREGRPQCDVPAVHV